MSINADVTKFLNYYLNPETKTDFAIMLNGPWGAGKTHFIKAYLKEREELARKQDPLQPIGHLYASLYGVRSTSEITDQFFAQAHPVLSSKGLRVFGTVLARAFNNYMGSDVNEAAENRSLIQDIVLKLNGRVLIFDDLERCAMPLAEAMGFINTFVEHEGLKVIVIANEDDIPGEQKEDYQRKKEKLVGKTLRVASDPELVIDSIIPQLKDTFTITHIKQNKDALIRTFNASGKQNFRSMRAVLTDYERIITSVDHKLRESPDAMKHLLLFMMATGVEFRSGNLNSERLSALPASRHARIILQVNKEKKTEEVERLDKLEATYTEVSWEDPIIPPTLLAKLFESGIVDVPAINNHLRQHPLVVGPEDSPAWRQLWSWMSLSGSQYQQAKDKLLTQLHQQEITHPGIILHVAGIILTLNSYNDYLLGETQDIEDYFRDYTTALHKSGKLQAELKIFRWKPGYESLGYSSLETPEFQTIYKATQDATQLSFSNKMKIVAGGFLERIQNNPAEYTSLHKHDVEQGNYGDAPFLHYIDPDKFAQSIIEDWSLNENLLSNLKARYEMDNYNGLLCDEYTWLKELQKSLQAIADRAKPPHKKLLHGRIEYYFRKIQEAVDTNLKVLTGNDQKEVISNNEPS